MRAIPVYVFFSLLSFSCVSLSKAERQQDSTAASFESTERRITLRRAMVASMAVVDTIVSMAVVVVEDMVSLVAP